MVCPHRRLSQRLDPQLYIDRPGGEHIIDTQIIEVPGGVGGRRYFRASRDNQITVEAADSILGSWTRLGDLSHMDLSGGSVEGPMWAKFNDRNEWCLWLDQHATNGGYLPVTSTDLGSTQNFRTVGDFDMGGSLKRHGSILNLTAAEENRLLERWEGIPVNRIQSYNFRDRHVRHQDFDVLLTSNVSPAQDAQFRLVPGLADSAGVSFESVNFPGYYLRHSYFDLKLEADDGTSPFAADATFHRESGLADESWTSFRSYNFPDQYIRHYYYELRLDPIDDVVGREDATFAVTD
ncbi:hypothetical protein GCM10029992_51420 [Glycomyces albus]